MGACRTKNTHRQAKRLCSGRQRWKSGKEIRNVQLQAVLLGSSMRFDKRKGIKERKSKKKVK